MNRNHTQPNTLALSQNNHDDVDSLVGGSHNMIDFSERTVVLGVCFRSDHSSSVKMKHSSPTTTTPYNKNQTKQVSFGRRAGMIDFSERSAPERYAFTEDQKAIMWYNDDELKAMKEKAKRIIAKQHQHVATLERRKNISPMIVYTPPPPSTTRNNNKEESWHHHYLEKVLEETNHPKVITFPSTSKTNLSRLSFHDCSKKSEETNVVSVKKEKKKLKPPNAVVSTDSPIRSSESTMVQCSEETISLKKKKLMPPNAASKPVVVSTSTYYNPVIRCLESTAADECSDDEWAIGTKITLSKEDLKDIFTLLGLPSRRVDTLLDAKRRRRRRSRNVTTSSEEKRFKELLQRGQEPNSMLTIQELYEFGALLQQQGTIAATTTTTTTSKFGYTTVRAKVDSEVYYHSKYDDLRGMYKDSQRKWRLIVFLHTPFSVFCF